MKQDVVFKIEATIVKKFDKALELSEAKKKIQPCRNLIVGTLSKKLKDFNVAKSKQFFNDTEITFEDVYECRIEVEKDGKVKADDIASLIQGELKRMDSYKIKGIKAI